MSKVEYVVAIAISAIISIVLMGGVMALFESSNTDSSKSHEQIVSEANAGMGTSMLKLAALKSNAVR